MTHFKNPKAYLVALVAGTLIFIGVTYLLPIIKSILAFIPENLFKNFLGLTPHIVITFAFVYMVYQEILERIGLKY